MLDKALAGALDDAEPFLAKLKGRERRFVEAYSVSLNATDAAIEAGYSAATARTTGYRLMKTARVVAAWHAVEDARAARSRITNEMILEELAKVAFGGDPREIGRWDSEHLELFDSGTIPEHAAKSIKGLKMTRTRRVSMGMDGPEPWEDEVVAVTLHDRGSKVRALELLGQHRGLFDRNRAVEGGLTLAEIDELTADLDDTSMLESG